MTTVTSAVWDDGGSPGYQDLDSEAGALDDLVVGGGLAGLTTALLLARAGRRVAVVEARWIGGGTTGHSTAKVSLLQGTKLSRMRRHHSRGLVQAYVEGNLEGQQWLLRFCDDHGVPVQRRPAVTYAASQAQIRVARSELEAADEAGLPVSWRESFDVPFRHHGGVVLEDQAQVDPVQVLRALTEQVREHGGLVHEGVRVTDVAWDGRTVTLDDGREIVADNVVLATGSPILDRGLYFAKLEAQRSYVVVMDGAQPPHEMFLSAGSPGRSVREVPQGRSSLLMVGGSGHATGRTDSEREHLDDLRAWTRAHFPGAVETHAWSAQDYSPPDGVPFVGPLPLGRGRVYVATGFDKWGLTNAVAAARSISTEILGGAPPSWQKPMRHRITGPRTAAELARINAAVGIQACRGLAGVLSRPRCTHLGGVLERNDAEGTWDCPLHGSRFDADGSVIEGPATRPLSL